MPDYSRIALSILFSFPVVQCCIGEDGWSQFRGASGTGITAAELPLNWNQQTNVAWRSEIDGHGWSSPVVVGDRIYLTAAIASGEPVGKGKPKTPYDLALLIVDAGTGKVITKKTLIEQSADEFKKIHAKNTHASPTPIIAGDRVYCHFGFQGTVCASLEGEIQWTNRELTFPPVHGNGGSPVLVDDLLVFTCDGAKDPYVAALNKDTGKLAWKRPRPVDAKKKFSFCTPTVIDVAGETQIIAPGSDCVLALRPSDGTIIWQVEYDGYSTVPKPVYENGMLFVCSGFDRGYLLAIDPTGSGNVTESHVRWQIDRGVPKTPSLIVNDGLLYLISDAGVAMCLEAESGERVWQERVGGKYSASPVLSRGRIYFTSEEGKTTVIRAGREYEVLAENDLKERTLASAAVIGNALLLRTDNALYRIETP